MRNNHNLVRPEKWELTCIIYKPRGEPKPLDVVDAVTCPYPMRRRNVLSCPTDPESRPYELYHYNSVSVHFCMNVRGTFT